MKAFFVFKAFLSLYLCSHQTAAQEVLVLKTDTLLIASSSSEMISKSDNIEVVKFFQRNSNGIVLLSSVKSDSILFSLVNDYREQSGLKPLTYSLRLDTLGKKLLYWLHYNEGTQHYSTMEQMKPFRDLLNVENIAYINNLSNQDFKFDPKQVLQGWIKSPPHNKALLADLHIGSASSLAKVVMLNNKLVIEIFSVFECDHPISKRELSQKYDSLNKSLIQRPIKFQKRKN